MKNKAIKNLWQYSLYSLSHFHLFQYRRLNIQNEMEDIKPKYDILDNPQVSEEKLINLLTSTRNKWKLM